MMIRNNDDDKGKMFVGGLSWQSTNESLKAYFSKFGEVVDCKVMMNRITGNSRGFGFVTYKDPASVVLVQSQSHHELDGKRIDPKGCNQHDANLSHKIKTSPKVFVGGLPFSVTKDELRTIFQQYGLVLDVNLMLGKDRDPARHRGFGFVTFESQETVDRLLELHYVEIQGRQVEIKKAEPQSSRPPGQGQWGGQDQWQQWGPQQAWHQGQWQQGQWGGQGGGWDQQQWQGYGPGYGYGYDQSWQQPPQGDSQWGAQGDTSQTQPPTSTSAAPPAAGYSSQPSSNGYGQQAYSGYSPYGQPPSGGTAAPPAAAPAPYGGYDSSANTQPPSAAPAAPAGGGYPPQQPAAAAPAAYGADASQQGYNRQQPGYHPYKR